MTPPVDGWPTDDEWPGAAARTAPPAALTGYLPLDDVIIESEAARQALEQIGRCVELLTAQVAAPKATPLDRQALQDWIAIREAKRRQRVGGS